ncbi:unnamed protein product [Oikopleura dioica]|uniref:Reverse transcriptase domain-containing protein n=1 Tax=Oikopleura dioica TaxID=34765 RepID=E4X9C8_OIKDI|nr:unnamed protein product [Oikopleura dioica]
MRDDLGTARPPIPIYNEGERWRPPESSIRPPCGKHCINRAKRQTKEAWQNRTTLKQNKYRKPDLDIPLITIDLTNDPDSPDKLLQATNNSILKELKYAKLATRIEIKQEILKEAEGQTGEPKHPSNNEQLFLSEIALILETANNQKSTNFRQRNHSQEGPEKVVEEMSTEDISLMDLNRTVESEKDGGEPPTTSLPKPTEHGITRKRKYDRILEKIINNTPKDRTRKVNDQASKKHTESIEAATKRLKMTNGPKMNEIIQKVKESQNAMEKQRTTKFINAFTEKRSGKISSTEITREISSPSPAKETEVSDTDSANENKPSTESQNAPKRAAERTIGKRFEASSPPEVIRQIFRTEQEREPEIEWSSNRNELHTQSDSQTRTNENNVSIRTNEQITVNTGIEKNGAKAIQSTPSLIRFDKFFIEKQKQFQDDDRTRKQFLADLENYQKICIESANDLKKGRSGCSDAWGLYKNPNKKKQSKALSPTTQRIMYLGGNKGILTQWEFALGYDHEDIPKNKSLIMQKIELCDLNKKALGAWFGRSENKELKHGKKQWITGLFAGAFAGQKMIDKIIDLQNNQSIIEYGFNTPGKIEEIKILKKTLVELSKLIKNPKRLASLWQSFPNILNSFIPKPMSIECARLVIEEFRLDDKHRDFPATSQCKTILAYLLEKQGIETIERRDGQYITRLIGNITGQFEEKNIPMLVATNCPKNKTIDANVRNNEIIDDTIINIIATNTKMEFKHICLTNLTNIWKDTKGGEILTEITKIDSFHPKGLHALLDYNFNNPIFSNKIGQHKQTLVNGDPPETEIKKNQIRLDIVEGRIPHGPLPNDLVLPDPHYAIKDVSNRLTHCINNIKSDLGNINQNRPNKAKIQKNHTRRENDKKLHESESFKKLAQTTGIKNPTDEEIEKLFSCAQELNEEAAEGNHKIEILSTNPGKACSRTCREIADIEPTASIYCLNELQISKYNLTDPKCWPTNHTIVCNTSSKDGLVYTAIMYKNYLKHLISVVESPGNTTAIDVKITNKVTKRYVATYRHNRVEEKCYYKKYYGANKYIFIDWINEIVKNAKKAKVQLTLTGDWNLELNGNRTEDDKYLIEKLNHAVRNLTNLITFPTHFRRNTRASQIDVFFVSHPKQMKIKSLHLHQPPTSYDGHSGHIVTAPLERPLEQYEVKVSKVINEENMYNYILEKMVIKKSEIENERDPERKIELSYNFINEAIDACSEKTGKIRVKGKIAHIPTPPDSWKYRVAARKLADEMERRKSQPEPDVEILKQIKINLIKISVICKKLYARDAKVRTNRIVTKISGENPKTFWDTVNTLLEEPPVRELKNDVEDHMEEVQKLQMKTATDPRNYEHHTFNPKHNVKLSNFKISLHGSTDSSSILDSYRTLKGHTKGHTGISRNLIDKLPIGAFRMLVLEPVLTAITNGCYPRAWKCNRTTILPKKKGIRPLSIAEIFSTMLERLIIKQLNDFLENNNLLHTSQNGFRQHLSTRVRIANEIKFVIENDMDPNLCTVVGITYIDNLKTILMNTYELTEWLKSDGSRNAATCLDLKSLVNDGVEDLGFDTYEQDHDSMGLPPLIDDLKAGVLGRYKDHHLPWVKHSKFYRWAEGNSLWAHLRSPFAQLEKQESWEYEMVYPKENGVSAASLQLTLTLFKKDDSNLHTPLGLLKRFITEENKNLPIKKIQKITKCMKARKIHEKTNGESFTFFAILSALGWQEDTHGCEKNLEHILEANQ